MLYERSVIPVIESKYALFTNTEKKIADYFLKGENSAEANIQDIAEALYVSQASISRFAKNADLAALESLYLHILTVQE